MSFVYALINAGFDDSNGELVNYIDFDHFNQLFDLIVSSKRNIGMNETEDRLFLRFDEGGSGIEFTYEFGKPTLILYKAKPKK
jgi:hypothetical protein